MAEEEKKPAITEAIFTISFDRPVTSVEADRIVTDPKIKDELPRLERPQIFQFNFGTGPRPNGLPPVPVELYRQRFNSHGDIEWRMGVLNNSLQVNCLVYDIWHQTWPIVLDHFRDAAKANIAPDDNKVTAISLNVINEFSKDDYEEPRACLSIESRYLPEYIQSTDRFMMQLDLNTETSAPAGHVSRTNLQITYGERQETGASHLATVAMLMMKPLKRLNLPDFLEQQATDCFGALRVANREMMKDLLTPNTCRRVGLEEEPANA